VSCGQFNFLTVRQTTPFLLNGKPFNGNVVEKPDAEHVCATFYQDGVGHRVMMENADAVMLATELLSILPAISSVDLNNLIRPGSRQILEAGACLQ